jgi:hypothetical protein
LRSGIELIADKAALRGVVVRPDEFFSRSLIAPACGLGSSSIAVAERVLEVLVETGEILKRG